MLLQRILTAVLLAPLAILIILLPPTWLFAAIVAAVFLGAQWEWAQLSGVAAGGARAALVVLTLALFGLLWWMRTNALWSLMLVVGVAWWLVACLWLRHLAFGAAPTAENRNIKALAGLFVIVPAWIALAMLHDDTRPNGHWWTLLALLTVWAADIGAYFSGRFLGKRKLAPRISPAKTWAGVYGAVGGGALVAAVGGWLLHVRDGRLLGLVLLAVLTVVAAVIGDLFESLLKRHAQVKDSGALFPGHGGLLDRLDSVFSALPVFALGKLLLGL